MKCAVLGDPIDHSLSPVLHRAGYAELGLTGWSYDAVRVPAGTLADQLALLSEDRAHALGSAWPPGAWRGLSLTMPLKREAVPLLASMSARGRLVGAVNTLVRTSYGWAGDNTDLPGAVAAVRERSSARVMHGVVLGAGATAASTGLALVELGARDVTLLARDADRAAETVAVIASHPAAPTVSVQPLEARPEADILVSTVPVAAQTTDLVARWRSVPVLFDVVYDPWPTPLVTGVSAASGVVVSGLDLLVHQAALQFTLFTGRDAPLGAMRAAGEQALGLTPAEAAGEDGPAEAVTPA
ncbi:shikimate dehydrogenase [Nocardioides sp. DS6]|uniref:Shikimate dehydrogenase n=1 Tax=Nocardioides eburneus TaxID=3231482 RepID=A0ABV3T460_9ACTN